MNRLLNKTIARAKKITQRPGTPNSYKPKEQYTVVSAVYNCAPYLEDFFDSMVNQTAGLKNLKLIMVDDGSTDDSLTQLESWQRRYPDSVTVITKANAGAASARNTGLQLVETEWVTFIDPDDFVAPDYFEVVDQAISKRPSLQMVNCYPVYFFENRNEFSDTHFLKDRFKSGNRFFGFNDDEKFITYMLPCTFMRISNIRNNGLTLSEEIRPNFEDGHFIARYELALDSGTIGYLKKPWYYYRKRAEKSSTLDTSWNGTDRLLNVPKKGYLDLLETAKESLGYIPRYIQRTIICDLGFYFKRFYDAPELAADFQPNEIEEFLSLLSNIFAYISPDVLFEVPGTWLQFKYKRAVLENFYQKLPPNEMVYIDEVNKAEQTFACRYYSNGLQLFLDGERVGPLHLEESSTWFFGENFQVEYMATFEFTSPDQILTLKDRTNTPVMLSINGYHRSTSSSIGTVIKRS